MSDTLKILDIDFAFIPADKGLNYIICKEFKEVFFDIFEINCSGNKIIAEKVDSLNGDPVLKIATEYDGKLYNSLYVLKEGDDNVILNVKSLDGGKKVFAKEKEILESVAEEESLPDPEPIVEETYIVTENAAVDIEKYKADAIRVINENFSNKKQKIEQLSESLTDLIDKRLSELKSSSVTDIDNLKSDILTKFDEKVNQVEIISDRAVAEANSIRESIEAIAELYTNIVTTNVDEKTKQLQDLKESVVYDINTKIAELQAELVNQETQVNSAFQSIQTFIDESKKQLLEQKTTSVADVENICNESKQVVTENLKRAETLVAKKINSLQSAADKKINDITTLVENRISIFDNRINDINGAIERAETSLQEQINQGLNSILTEARSHSAILDDKKNEIEKIISNTANELSELGGNIVESVEKKIKDFNLVAIKKEDLNSLKKQLETRIENESANLKKYVAGYGGGGSVAQQFAAGGTMNGTLNVASGQILSAGVDLATIFAGGGGGGYQTLTFTESSAALTITPFGNTVSLSSLAGGSTSGAYLPLSGGTVTGNVTVTGTLSTTTLYATSAYMTVIDITQYELSGFNVTGNVTVNGQVSSTTMATNYIDFTPLTVVPPQNDGRLYYDQTERTLVFWDGDPTLKYPINKMLWTIGVNKTGSIIPKGSVVYLSGAQGNRGKMWPAIATNDIGSADTIGITMQDTAINQEGYIMAIGELEGIDTRAYAEGTTLYLSPLSAGKITDVKPQAPNHIVKVGFSLNSTVNGKIYVEIDNGYELDELHNVRINGVQNGQTLTYNALSSLWVNTTLQTAYLPLSGGTLTGAVSTNQDIEITDSTKGIILKSSGGFKYRVTVTDAGELVTTSV